MRLPTALSSGTHETDARTQKERIMNAAFTPVTRQRNPELPPWQSSVPHLRLHDSLWLRTASMKRSHFASLMFATATISCSDNTAPAGPFPIHSGDDALSLEGTLTLNPKGNPRLLLRTASGEVVALFGENSAPLDSLIGAQVLAQGEQWSLGAMYVESFLILSVNELPARDGLLVRTPTGGYAMDLTAGPSGRPIVRPSPEFQSLVGHRIWVTGPEDGPPMAFGVIW